MLISPNVLSAQSSISGKEVPIKDMLESKEGPQQSLEQSDYSGGYNIPKDDFGRGQPSSAIAGYLGAMRSGDLALATNYLDYRNLSEKH